MTAFRYAAARADGATVRGRLEAASRPDAAALLSARGLYPVLVEAEPAGKSWWPPRPSVRSRAEVIQSLDRKSTRLNSSHPSISYAVFCLKKKKKQYRYLAYKLQDIK